jgi:hypothetical protein
MPLRSVVDSGREVDAVSAIDIVFSYTKKMPKLESCDIRINKILNKTICYVALCRTNMIVSVVMDWGD